MKNLLPRKESENYFGYNIFSNTDIGQFQILMNLSILTTLLVLAVEYNHVMGETMNSSILVIYLRGFLFIPNIGQVFVNGLTLEKLEKKLFKLLKKHTLLDPDGNAKTFFDVSLGATTVRPIRITLLGEVEQAGFKNLNSSLNFFNSLFYFGGQKHLAL